VGNSYNKRLSWTNLPTCLSVGETITSPQPPQKQSQSQTPWGTSFKNGLPYHQGRQIKFDSFRTNRWYYTDIRKTVAEHYFETQNPRIQSSSTAQQTLRTEWPLPPRVLTPESEDSEAESELEYTKPPHTPKEPTPPPFPLFDPFNMSTKPTTTITSDGSIRMRTPPDFNGNKSKYEEWIDLVEGYLNANSKMYDNDEKKIGFALSFMTSSNATKWQIAKRREHKKRGLNAIPPTFLVDWKSSPKT